MAKNKKMSASNIKLQEFTVVGGIGKKGYDIDEVRDFLNQVAKYVEELEKKAAASAVQTSQDTTFLETQIEQLTEENENLKREIERLKNEIAELKSKGGGGPRWEDIPQELLANEIIMAAKRAGDSLIEEKKREAEKILEDAKKELQEINLQLAKAKEELKNIENQKTEILSKLDEVKKKVKSEILTLAKKVEDFANEL